MPFLTQLSATSIRSRIASLFSNDPVVDSLPVPDMWSLSAPLVYRSALKKCTITCPIGVTSDLASTPKLLQWIGFLDDDGKSRPAGITHDVMYRLGRENGKEWCDEVLREMCLDLGMKRWQAFVYYWAVRLFAGSGWRDDGANAAYGDPRKSNFISEADYAAFIASGGSIFSQDKT